MVRHSKGNEYCFDLAGTSNYQIWNYRGPTADGLAQWFSDYQF